MASPFDYTNVAPYAALGAEQLLVQSRRNPLQEMIAAYQAPQKYAQEQAAAQLQAQIQQANLQKLQRPQVFNTATGLYVEDPNNQTGFTLVPGTSPVNKNYIETSAGMLEPIPGGGFKNVFPFTQKSPFTQQQITNIDDPKKVRMAFPDENGEAPAGWQFSKAMEQPMKPSEVISSQREIRNTYEEMPSKVQLFGKGQVPGSFQVKSRLDAMMTPVKGDFTKLNPQAKLAFVNAMNNLKDPTSATLTTEAAQIASRVGVLDRMESYVQNIKKGDQVSPQVAKDIYEVVNQIYNANKEEFLENITPTINSLKTLNKDLTDIGVPVKFAKEVKDRVKASESQQQEQQAFTNIVTPGGAIKKIPSALVPEALKRGARLQ